MALQSERRREKHRLEKKNRYCKQGLATPVGVRHSGRAGVQYETRAAWMGVKASQISPHFLFFVIINTEKLFRAHFVQHLFSTLYTRTP